MIAAHRDAYAQIGTDWADCSAFHPGLLIDMRSRGLIEIRPMAGTFSKAEARRLPARGEGR